MDQPHQHAVPVYGAKIQYSKLADPSPKLCDKDEKFIQQVTGTFLYYARAVDATMLLAFGAIVSDQASPTEETMRTTLIFLDYVTIHPDTILAFDRSSMMLSVHRNASYLCESKAKRSAGKDPRDNKAVLNIAKSMKNMMSSAAEAGIGALCFLTQDRTLQRELL